MADFRTPASLLVKAHYDMDADALFKRAICFADMMEATRPISSYRGLPAQTMEPGQTYRTDVRVFGLFNTRDYDIRVESICDASRRIETSESGGGVRMWRHTLEVQQDGDGAVWIDRVTIDAGGMTPVLARYARFMYRHRHARRKAASISTSLNRSCRIESRDMPVFHPVVRELDKVAAPLAIEEVVIPFRPAAASDGARPEPRSRIG